LYNKGKIPMAWIIQNNELYCKPDTFTVEHGDLVTDKEYRILIYALNGKLP
jgi:hypothetical protein